MCTVVVRWSTGQPVRVLALRDELTTRPFDDPGRWWPDQPDVVAGRDRLAGGTWCASRVATGTTALVLNRARERVAAPGAASRGVLPLLGVAHGTGWRDHVDLTGMAGFLLVLAAPDRLLTWDFDGERLRETEHPEGTVMVTSGGPEDRKTERHLDAFRAADPPEGWRDLVRQAPPRDDPGALVVRHEEDGRVFATVFGQLVEAEPGRLRLDHSREPWTARPWHTLAVEPGAPRVV
ncbi:Transport and Golgi organisation 2 [Geodermatophilus telluris]|uniref:Transport and Golgi organisation 2 n=1 Tax=Geodermatophilus telluris TaxID=1190417 RepID=A0A1G6TMI2_9ACTN|nr:NRDE family protein [Geodermatophilus telluris]SDD30239.1 Transport and Golgi organisation 2 [Geodermatophilus telluris]